MKNVSTFTWKAPSKGNDGSLIYGKNKTASVQSATKRLPRSRDGIAIPFNGDQQGEQTQQRTECSFTPTVINKSTARVYTWRNRVLQRALERLERAYGETHTCRS